MIKYILYIAECSYCMEIHYHPRPHIFVDVLSDNPYPYPSTITIEDLHDFLTTLQLRLSYYPIDVTVFREFLQNIYITQKH